MTSKLWFIRICALMCRKHWNNRRPISKRNFGFYAALFSRRKSRDSFSTSFCHLYLRWRTGKSEDNEQCVERQINQKSVSFVRSFQSRASSTAISTMSRIFSGMYRHITANRQRAKTTVNVLCLIFGKSLVLLRTFSSILNRPSALFDGHLQRSQYS